MPKGKKKIKMGAKVRKDVMQKEGKTWRKLRSSSFGETHAERERVGC
jgi:hypothetical protein